MISPELVKLILAIHVIVSVARRDGTVEAPTALEVSALNDVMLVQSTVPRVIVHGIKVKIIKAVLLLGLAVFEEFVAKCDVSGPSTGLGGDKHEGLGV